MLFSTSLPVGIRSKIGSHNIRHYGFLLSSIQFYVGWLSGWPMELRMPNKTGLGRVDNNVKNKFGSNLCADELASSAIVHLS